MDISRPCRFCRHAVGLVSGYACRNHVCLLGRLDLSGTGYDPGDPGLDSFDMGFAFLFISQNNPDARGSDQSKLVLSRLACQKIPVWRSEGCHTFLFYLGCLWDCTTDHPGLCRYLPDCSDILANGTRYPDFLDRGVFWAPWASLLVFNSAFGNISTPFFNPWDCRSP